MLLYKVVGKITANNEFIRKRKLEIIFDFETPNVIGYKINAGLSVFYITESVYQEGAKLGLIEPIEGNVPDVDFAEYWSKRGHVVKHRLQAALKQSTIPFLKEELDRINKGPKFVLVTAYDTSGWLQNEEIKKEPILRFLHHIRVDLNNREVLENTADKTVPDIIKGFSNVETYDGFIDRLVFCLDRELKNSSNLYELFMEVDFISVDGYYERSEKFEFGFNQKYFLDNWMPKLKYKVSGKVVVSDDNIKKYHFDEVFSFTTPNLIGYKITAGLYIFYITEQIYEEGVAKGIIEPMKEDVPDLDYRDFTFARGRVVDYRMKKALELSTIPYLTQELYKFNEGSKLLKINVYKASNWWVNGGLQDEPDLEYFHHIVVDLEKREVIENTAKDDDPIYCLGFKHIKTYDAFLDRLAFHLDREYMNSRNLFEKFRQVEFYCVDEFMQRHEKFEFIFIE